MAKMPGLFVYAADWFGELNLKKVSWQTRLVWLEMLIWMSQTPRYGHMVDSTGKAVDANAASRLFGTPEKVMKRAYEELVREGVCSLSENGAIYSRRMVADLERTMQYQALGSKGGRAARSSGTVEQDAPAPRSSATVEPTHTRGRSYPTLPNNNPLTPLAETAGTPSGSSSVPDGAQGDDQGSRRGSGPQPVSASLAKVTNGATPPNQPTNEHLSEVIKRASAFFKTKGQASLVPHMPTKVIAKLAKQLADGVDLTTDQLNRLMRDSEAELAATIALEQEQAAKRQRGRAPIEQELPPPEGEP